MQARGDVASRDDDAPGADKGPVAGALVAEVSKKRKRCVVDDWEVKWVEVSGWVRGGHDMARGGENEAALHRVDVARTRAAVNRMVEAVHERARQVQEAMDRGEEMEAETAARRKVLEEEIAAVEKALRKLATAA